MREQELESMAFIDTNGHIIVNFRTVSGGNQEMTGVLKVGSESMSMKILKESDEFISIRFVEAKTKGASVNKGDLVLRRKQQ